MKTIWSVSPEPNQKIAPRMWTNSSIDRTQTMAAAESSICADEPAMEARAAAEPGGARRRAGAPGAGGCGPARRPAVRRAVERAGALGVSAVWAVRERNGLQGLADGAGRDLGSAVLRDRRKEVGAGAWVWRASSASSPVTA